MMGHKGVWVAAIMGATLGLSGCENSAVALQVEGREHALILVREQRLPFAEIEQFVVVSRLPVCQRRWRIQSDDSPMAPMRVFEMGDLLWALEQKGKWYLATTEDCRVQVWPNPNSDQLGPLVGTFEEREGKKVFTRAPRE
ncbi:MAG: hypothetical protein N2557_03420 [Hydrogenophilus sp.]|nr:hypothetical protein [Hydrogenophilus sp.]